MAGPVAAPMPLGACQGLIGLAMLLASGAHGSAIGAASRADSEPYVALIVLGIQCVTMCT